jgi:hypothetical protein
MQSLLNQRVERQEQKMLVGGILLYRDSFIVGVNYSDLCCVAAGCLYYPLDGNLLARDTNLVPIKEEIRKLEQQFGEDYSLMDYRPPLKQRYILLAEYTATSLGELNELLERLNRQFHATCYCPSQDREFAQASQLCQPLTSVHKKEFLVSNFESIMGEPERCRVMDGCKRLLNKDPELVLAASVAINQLENEKFMVDPVSRGDIDSREKEVALSYA